MADRPKRRKYKDNPYTLNYIEEKNIYMVRKYIKHLIDLNQMIYQK